MLLWFITSCPHPSWGISLIPDPKGLMGAKKQPKKPTKIMHFSWWFLLSPIVATKLKFGKSRSLPNAPKFFLLDILGDTKVPLNVRRNLKILQHSNRPIWYTYVIFGVKEEIDDKKRISASYLLQLLHNQ